MDNTNQLPYKEEVTQYSKKDAAHALLFAAYITLTAFCSSVLAAVFEVNDTDGQMTFMMFFWAQDLQSLPLLRYL